MKKIVYLLVLISVSVSGQNQQESDSLIRLLPTLPNDTNKVWMLEKIASIYEVSKTSMSKEYAQKGLDLARQLQFGKGEVMCLLRIGRAYTTGMNYPKGLEYQLEALKIAETIQYKIGSRRVIGQLSRIYRAIGNYDLTLIYNFKTLKLAEETNTDIDNALRGTGETYMLMNKLDSALYYFQKAYDSIKREDISRGSSIPINIMMQLGDIHSKLGNHKTAMKYFQESVSYSLKTDNKPFLSAAYVNIAQIYRKLGRRDSSSYFAHKAFDYAKEINFIPLLNDASTTLAWAYDSTAPQKAVMYYKLAASTRDSIFNQERFIQYQKLSLDEQRRQQEIVAERERYNNRLWQYGLLLGLLFMGVIALILFRNNRLKQQTNQQLQQQKDKIEHTLTQLKSTQTQLIQKEKMASLGELTAGIAHEIQNPLNFVTNFSEVSTELVGELVGELDKGDPDEAKAIAGDLSQNLQKITLHGQRASSIVKGMLEHSRTSTGEKQPTDLNALADEYLRLAYHGLRAKDKDFNAELKTDFDPNLGKVNVVPQELGRVLLNLLNNAFYAVQQRANQSEAGYQPTVSISTRRQHGQVEIRVSDNGTGMPEAVKAKIFQPFFTTKPTGQGTGLGLSLSYDIVTKGHGGTLTMESAEGQGTTFTVHLPTLT